MDKISLKPCPFARNPGPHELSILPVDLIEFMEYTLASTGKRVECSCGTFGPCAADDIAAAAKWNNRNE